MLPETPVVLQDAAGLYQKACPVLQEVGAGLREAAGVLQETVGLV